MFWNPVAWVQIPALLLPGSLCDSVSPSVKQGDDDTCKGTLGRAPPAGTRASAIPPARAGDVPALT